MELYYSYGAALIALAALTGLGISFHFYSRKQTSRMVDLYKKLESSETSARRAKEQYLHIQEEAVNLRNALERERKMREEAVTGYRETARKRFVSVGAACLAAGLFAGGTVSGLLVYSFSETAHLKRTIDLQVRARVGEERAGMLGAQVAKLQEENQKLFFSLFEARETEAVMQAKMEVLLDHLSVKKGNPRLMLDVEALRSSLRQQEGASGSEGGILLPQAVKI